MKDYNLSDKEAAAIKVAQDAIKALPKSIWIETDSDEGELRFWKRVSTCESKQAADVLRHRAVRG